MTTTILGRLLLHLRRTECRPPAFFFDPASNGSDSGFEFDPALASPDSSAAAEEWDRRRSRAISPFGLIPLAKRFSGGSAHSSDADLSGTARGPSLGLGLLGHGRGHGRGHGHERMDSVPDSFEDVIHIAPPTYHYRKRTHDPGE